MERQPHKKSKRFPWIPEKLVFTLIFSLLLVTAAILTGSLMHALTPAWQDRLGFAPRDLFTFHWIRILTSAFVTAGGIGFLLPLGATLILLAAAEKITGTGHAVLAFWLSHVGATVGGSLVTWLAIQWITSPLLNAIYTARDVGPSAGYFGCLGLIVAHFPRRWKYVVGLAIIAGLIGGMVVSAHQGAHIDVSAGLAHLLAFPIGWGTTEVSFFKKLRA
jgi:hypothetical protein